MRPFFAIALCEITFSIFSQSLVGKYDSRNESHTNRFHYEELILESDQTFKYSMRMEFIRIDKNGVWIRKGDTLVLNENNPCCKEKMNVKEEYDKTIPKGNVRFFVNSLLGEGIVYHLIATDNGTADTIWSQTGTTEVRNKKFSGFHFIVGSFLVSPEYRVISPRSNIFRVQLASERFFYDEKWLIRNGRIVPIGEDNQYAKYYLGRQN